uniref:Uncharacterized protein n=1 Tax=Anguilla anguilla TaxID=7936 RepID=A0A0E9UFP3_ANGAN
MNLEHPANLLSHWTHVQRHGTSSGPGPPAVASGSFAIDRCPPASDSRTNLLAAEAVQLCAEPAQTTVASACS